MEKKKVDAVFEGGGVKGIGLVGAAEMVEERGYEWSNLAGTSAGAIVASLLAAGYKASELRTILMDLDYNKFKDKSWADDIPLVGPTISLLFQEGIYEGKYFEDWLRARLLEKGKRTFKDLIMEDYEEDRYRFRLNVIASDISQGRLLVLPQDMKEYGMEPEGMDIARAVRMSMGIPYFYEPVRMTYTKEGKHLISYIVDGGLLSNFPVWLFDSPGEPQWPTFGFKLVEPKESRVIAHDINGPITMLGAMFSTMIEAHDARYIKDSEYVRTIPIPTLGVKTTDFDITRERSEELYQAGRKAAEVFLEKWDFARYVDAYRREGKRASRGDRLREA